MLARWRQWTVFPVTIAALVGSCGAAVATARAVLAEGPVHYYLGGWMPPWGIEFRIDSLGALMVLLLSGITLLVAVYSRRSILQELPGREAPFYCVYLLLVGGLLDSPAAVAVALGGLGAILLTVAYSFGAARRIFFGPLPDALDRPDIRDPGWTMTVPLFAVAALSIVLGLYPRIVMDLFHTVLGGI